MRKDLVIYTFFKASDFPKKEALFHIVYKAGTCCRTCWKPRKTLEKPSKSTVENKLEYAVCKGNLAGNRVLQGKSGWNLLSTAENKLEYAFYKGNLAVY